MQAIWGKASSLFSVTVWRGLASLIHRQYGPTTSNNHFLWPRYYHGGKYSHCLHILWFSPLWVHSRSTLLQCSPKVGHDHVNCFSQWDINRSEICPIYAEHLSFHILFPTLEKHGSSFQEFTVPVLCLRVSIVIEDTCHSHRIRT